MRYLMFVILIWLLTSASFNVLAQEAMFLNEAMEKIASTLTNQLNARGIQQAGVADFSYQGRANTRIGKQMADELSVRLTMSAARFVMTNREVVRKALSTSPPKKQVIIPSSTTSTLQQAFDNEGKTEEEKQQDQINAGIEVVSLIPSLLKNGKLLKGTDAVIYGKIEDRGDYFNLIIEVTENSKRAANIGGTIINIIKTKDLEELTAGQVQAVLPIPNGGNTTDATSTPLSEDTPKFKHQYLQFEVISCIQTGREVECKLNIIASQDLNYNAWFSNTRFFNAKGNTEYPIAEIRLADISSTSYRVEKSLVKNTPMIAILRFIDVEETVTQIARLDINSSYCCEYQQFIAALYNISVQ
ncbi:MAG: hypothetical protein HC892_16410 [Saprospiraceae bacterium]|nr:hypothetical protein [Saprospiraceae bacterium]